MRDGVRQSVCSAVVALSVLLYGRPASAQALTLAQVEESIAAIGTTIQREYFDRQVGRQVAASLREGVAEGRFPNLATAQDVADAMNHELQFLTHDTNLVVSIIRDRQQQKSTTSSTVRTFRVNGWLQVAVPVRGRVGVR